MPQTAATNCQETPGSENQTWKSKNRSRQLIINLGSNSRSQHICIHNITQLTRRQSGNIQKNIGGKRVRERKTIKCRSRWGAFWGSPPRWRRSVFSGHADSRRGTEERVSPQSRAAVVFLQLNLNDYWCARHLPLPVSPKKDRAANKGECKESSTRHKTHRKFLQTPDKDTSVFTAACRAGLPSGISQHQKEKLINQWVVAVFPTYVYVAYSKTEWSQ